MAEDLEVAGGGGLGQAEDVGEFADAERLVEEETEQPPAGLVGEGVGEGDQFPHREKS
jgi:hypothetical protein